MNSQPEMNDAERIQIAIAFIDSQPRETQLLKDYNEMITNLTVLLMYTKGNPNAVKVACQSLFLLGCNAVATSKEGA